MYVQIQYKFCEENGFPKIPQKVQPKKYPNGENFLSHNMYFQVHSIKIYWKENHLREKFFISNRNIQA